MTEPQQKEQLSIHFLGTLAARAGYFVNRPYTDSGIDIIIEKIEKYILLDNKVRYLNAGKSIDIQLKCTTEKNIIREKKHIKFDLDVVNFNDLVYRRNAMMTEKKAYLSMYLILFVLPEKITEWVKQKNKGLTLNGQAFWYSPDNENSYSSNKETKRIIIPNTQKIDLDFFDEIFKLSENA